MMYRKLLLLLSILILISFNLSAQFFYRQGMVITNNNDTLTGFIIDRGGYMNARKCIFKQDKNSKRQVFTPENIKAYKFIGNENYVTQDLFYKGQYLNVFATVLLEGDISLYYYWRNKEMLYFLKQNNKTPVALLNIEGKTPTQLKNFYNERSPDIFIDIYKDTLYSVFKDSEKILKKIENVKYNKKSLANITKLYLKEKCPSGNCIQYEFDLKKYRPTFGIYAGMQLVNSERYIPIFTFVNFPLEFFSPRLSIQPELKLFLLQSPDSSVNTNGKFAISNNTLTLPFVLKYRLLPYKFSPLVGLGKELNYTFKASNKDYTTYSYINSLGKNKWFFEATLDYKFGKHTGVYTSLRVSSYTFKPEKLHTGINLQPPDIQTNTYQMSVGLYF